MADRQEWEHATARSRRMAIAADTELSRRHTDQKIAPLRFAEPVPVSDAEHKRLHLAAGGRLTEATVQTGDLAVQRQTFREKMAERQRLLMPGEDLDWIGLDETSPSLLAPGHSAIMQPPKPQITPSATILQIATEHDTELEAAD